MTNLRRPPSNDEAHDDDGTAGVDFVLVGGMAGAAHGSSVVTEDVDVCIRFDRDTVERVLSALRDAHPRSRMQPNRPPLDTNPET